MSTFRKFRVVLYLTLLFVAGTALGLGWSRARRPAWTQSPEWAERWLERRMAADFAAIQATPEQQAALRPSYDQLLADFRAVQADAESKIKAAFGRFGLAISRKVTPEQLETLKQHHLRSKAARESHPSKP